MPERQVVFQWSVQKRSDEYPDRFLTLAKELVVDNYNRHHDSGRTPPLTMGDVFIVWFVKTLENWKAVVGSSVLRGLLYEVSYNGEESEAYIEIFKKINSTKVTIEREK
jgi:hypothetical protein